LVRRFWPVLGGVLIASIVGVTTGCGSSSHVNPGGVVSSVSSKASSLASQASSEASQH